MNWNRRFTLTQQTAPLCFAEDDSDVYFQNNGNTGKVLRQSTNKIMVHEKEQRRSKPLKMNGGYQTEGISKCMMASHVVEINSDSTTKSQQQRRELLNARNTQKSNGENSQAAASEDYTQSRRCKANTSTIGKDPPTTSYSTPGSGCTREEADNPQKFSNWRNISPTGLCDDIRLRNVSVHKQHQYRKNRYFNSQISVTEKIRSWKCSDETSDVEDVGSFEREYESFEARKKQHIQEWKENKNAKSYEPPKYIGKEEFKNYDFSEFQQRIMQRLQNKSNKVRRFHRPDILTSQSNKSKRKKSSVNTAYNNHTTSNDGDNDTLRKEHDARNKVGKSKKSMNFTANVENDRTAGDGSNREEEEEEDGDDERLMSDNLNSRPLNNQYDANPFENLSVFRVKGNRSQKEPIEPNELASLFKLHQFPNVKNSAATSTSKWKYPTKYNEEAENRLIQVHLDFENCKKDMDLNNKKKELFDSKDAARVNSTKKSTQNSIPVAKTASSATITLRKESSSETIDGVAADTPAMHGDCLRRQQQPTAPPATGQSSSNNVVGDNDVVCHQQHEFCNYLGLTGMSTATAMANAVAELAQSNLTRRSLRVLRQQQKGQQQKNSTSNEQQQDSTSPKEKQTTNESKKATGDQMDQTPNQSTGNMEVKSTMKLKSSTPSNRSSYGTVTTSVPLKRQTSIQLDQGEPRIKIMYQISASSKKDAAIKSKKCIEDIRQPLRETIQEHFQQQLSKMQSEAGGNRQDKKEMRRQINGSPEKSPCRKTSSKKIRISKPQDDEEVNVDEPPESATDYIPIEKQYLRKMQECEVPTTSKNSMYVETKCPWTTKRKDKKDENTQIPTHLKTPMTTYPSIIEEHFSSLPKEKTRFSELLNTTTSPERKSPMGTIIYKELNTSVNKADKDSSEINLFEHYQKALEASRQDQPRICIQDTYSNMVTNDKIDSLDPNKLKSSFISQFHELNISTSKSNTVTNVRTARSKIRQQSQMLMTEEFENDSNETQKAIGDHKEIPSRTRRLQSAVRRGKSAASMITLKNSSSLVNNVCKNTNRNKCSKNGAKGKLKRSQCIKFKIHKKKNNFTRGNILKRLGKRLKAGKCKNIFADHVEKTAGDDHQLSASRRTTITTDNNVNLINPLKGKEFLTETIIPQPLEMEMENSIVVSSNGRRIVEQIERNSLNSKTAIRESHTDTDAETHDEHFDGYLEEPNNCQSRSSPLLQDEIDNDNHKEKILQLQENAIPESQRITRSLKQQYNGSSPPMNKSTKRTNSNNSPKMVTFNIISNENVPGKVLVDKKRTDDKEYTDIGNMENKIKKKTMECQTSTEENDKERAKATTTSEPSNTSDFRYPSYIKFNAPSKSTKPTSVRFLDKECNSKKGDQGLVTMTTTTTTSTTTIVSSPTYDATPSKEDTGCAYIEDVDEENVQEMPSTITVTTTNESLLPEDDEEEISKSKSCPVTDEKYTDREELVSTTTQHKVSSTTCTQSIGTNTLSMEELLQESPSVETRSTASQSEVDNVHCLHWSQNNLFQLMPNPLKIDYGKVLHIYYELDVLIVVQELLISFWKCSRLCNILDSESKQQPAQSHHKAMNNGCSGTSTTSGHPINCFDNNTEVNNDRLKGYVWLPLGELRHLNFDAEIEAPYANRICVHNSMPIYIEMRGRQLPSYQRESNLISMYINLYYYNEEQMAAKSASIHMDTIQSAVDRVNYTTIIDSRYFIMTWQEENSLNKIRSGLCKYSLTPQLDTLASIREFKSVRHVVRYLECMPDGKLIGFGDRQITVWDHSSGDVLMNYDLGIDLGTNVGTVIYPGEMPSTMAASSSMMLLFQYRWRINMDPITPELLVIACKISATSPTYRVLHKYQLSATEFNGLAASINTDEYVIIKGQNSDKEIWISCTNPGFITSIPTKDTLRFYGRHSNQVIEMNDISLGIESVTNMVMKLAAGLTN